MALATLAGSTSSTMITKRYHNTFLCSHQGKGPVTRLHSTTRVELSYQSACQHTTRATLHQTNSVTVIQTERAEAAESTHDASYAARVLAQNGHALDGTHGMTSSCSTHAPSSLQQHS